MSEKELAGALKWAEQPLDRCVAKDLPALKAFKTLARALEGMTKDRNNWKAAWEHDDLELRKRDGLVDALRKELSEARAEVERSRNECNAHRAVVEEIKDDLTALDYPVLKISGAIPELDRKRKQAEAALKAKTEKCRELSVALADLVSKDAATALIGCRCGECPGCKHKARHLRGLKALSAKPDKED